ncbi:hypothetical protein [Peribacillus butanolivorans]
MLFVGIVHIGNETSRKLKSEDIAIEVDGIDVILDGQVILSLMSM